MREAFVTESLPNMPITGPSLVPGETLRILLVSTQEALRAELDQAQARRIGDHALYWISQPELAAARVRELLPHAIVVDDELGGQELAQVVRQLAAQTPAALLALVDAGSMAAARQAVLAGARAFVVKPLAADDFAATLRQVLVGRRAAGDEATLDASAGGRIVVFVAPKGGTGRTTLAANTAVSLHRTAGKRVVLLDADYAAPALDVALNLHGERDIADLLDRLTHLDAHMVEQVIAPHASGLHLLLAPPPGAYDGHISLPQVQQILAQLKRMYDWVIVDLGLPLDETAFAFLDGADRIVMTVLPEMVGLRNTRVMLDQLHARGHSEQRIWLVVNRAGIRGGVARADIERRLHIAVRHTVPDDQPLVSLSVNRGVPLVLSHPRSAVARAVRELAVHLAAEVDPSFKPAPAHQPAAPRPSLLQRWRARLRLVHISQA